MADAISDVTAHNPHCFPVRGREPSGLRFRIAHREPSVLRGTVGPLGQEHEGGIRRVHGGVLVTALDEVLGQLCHLECGGDCMTAQLNVRFRRPGANGDTCEAAGRGVRREGRKIWMEGEIVRDGEVLCSAEGLWLEARRD